MYPRRSRRSRRIAVRLFNRVIEPLECRRLLALINPGFEGGDLAGWAAGTSPDGSAHVVNADGGRTAVEGSHFALLTTGEEPGTTWISQPFHGEAGDILTGQAFFRADQSFASGDTGRVELLAGDGSVLATLFSASALVDPHLSIPWTPFTWTVPATGNYTLRAWVTSLRICSNPDAVGLDALTLTPTPPTTGNITAAPDDYTTDARFPLSKPAPGVLGNDYASNGAAALGAALATPPQHGTLQLNTDGSFIYTPQAGYAGPDSFQYTASSPGLSSSIAVVHIDVRGGNGLSITSLTAPATATEGIPFSVTGEFTDNVIGTHTITIAWPGGSPQTLAYSSALSFSTSHLFPVGTAASGPQFLTVPVTITNYRGDSTSGHFELTLNPAPPLTLSLSAPAISDEMNVVVQAHIDGIAESGTTASVVWSDGLTEGPSPIMPDFTLSRILPPGTLPPGTSQVLSVEVTVTNVGGQTATASTSTTLSAPDPADAGLVYDLRFADGSKSQQVSGPGVYRLDLWAQVHSSDGDFTDNSPSTGSLSLRSFPQEGGAILGGVTSASPTPQWTVPAQTYPGHAANLTDDGVQDWGSTSSNSTDGTLRYLASSFSPWGVRTHVGGVRIPGESRQVDDHTWEWRIATFTVSVDGLTNAADGITQFLPLVNSYEGVNQSYGTAYYADRSNANSDHARVTRNRIAVGSPVQFVRSPAAPATVLAAPDQYATPQDHPLTIAAPGLLANDTGPGATAALLTSPAHGTVDLHPDGGFTYTPAPGYAGLDLFIYRASAPGLSDASASVAIDVTPTQPTLTLSVPATVTQGWNLGISGSFTDPASGPRTLRIDWPDGTSSTLAIAPGETTFDQYHALPPDLLPPGATSQPLTVSATLTTSTGQTVTASAPFTLVAPPSEPPLTYDLRFPDGSKLKQIGAPGDYPIALGPHHRRRRHLRRRQSQHRHLLHPLRPVGRRRDPGRRHHLRPHDAPLDRSRPILQRHRRQPVG